ncbi:MAG TPA: D-alanyl-D-alanine carboxypeptidase family protein [Gaiellaceae bacterium]|jgi:D-alanyl-D-alanine carboxypeptidase (penicillin-binding protein 5/6)|nr:D-alanyl-D-alanine carboxypeptidase family protein [Gaiellaceae bacterium]
MRRLLVGVALALAFAGTARAAVPQPDARAFYVVNAANGEVLAAHAADARLPIASITKLMTVLVALKRLDLDQVVTVPARAAHVGGSRIPLRAGQQITVRDLLKGALIQSANDAADSLAAAASGGDLPLFVSWMNAWAQRLGLHDTHFVRPDGLDAPGHVSSARDVALLARVAMRLPIVRSIVREHSDVIEDGRFTVHTWNDLLGVFPGLIGVKTGHTDKAGWCEVAAARRRGYTIYVVILGSPTRAQRNADLQRLLSWGVAQYRTLTLVAPQPYTSASLSYGLPAVPLVASKPLVRVVRVGRPVVQRVIASSAAALPVREGQRLGRIEIWVGGRLFGARPLLAARSAARPGLGGRLRWYATRTVHDLWGIFS